MVFHCFPRRHHLRQGLDGRAVVRNGPAGLPLAVPLRIPVSLFGHLEPHRFLHRFVGSLAFGSILCYTVFSRKVRAFTALLGFEYRVSAFLLFVLSVLHHPILTGFHQNRTLRGHKTYFLALYCGIHLQRPPHRFLFQPPRPVLHLKKPLITEHEVAFKVIRRLHGGCL